MPISQYGTKARLHSIRIINRELDYYKIDLSELGWEYFELQPSSCIDCVGPPEEQKEWHISHIGMCLKTLKAIEDFQKTLIELITRKSKEFDKKKEKVIEKIKQKAQQINYKDKIGEDYSFENS